ncbi:MAG: copper resistance system multicopper oxidase [Spongiibacteraceae bacterium]
MSPSSQGWSTGRASVAISRRQFVQGLVAGGAVSTMASLSKASGAPLNEGFTPVAPVLRGTEFELVVASMPVNYTGVTRIATAINGSIPAPTLIWREGETVTIRVTNTLSVSTSIHWHGMILPFEMDGVPNISFAGIAPGKTFSYQFKVQQSGTYWYHSHSGFQEMTGMYGSIIIQPAVNKTTKVQRDYVVQLADWTDENPMAVFNKLKQQGDYYNFNQPTVPDFLRDASTYGVSEALAKRRMWNQMRMSPTDLADVSATTFTYLMNGVTPLGNWTGLFSPGEKLRLRFINGSSNTFYDVRIPGVPLTVVQADGQDVEPVTVDEFRFGPGQTYDVIVEPKGEVHTIFAQSMDRSGYARGTLAVRAGLSAPVPKLDAPMPLTMSDMMGSMSHGDGSAGMSSHAGMAHSGMAMDHSQHSNVVNKPLSVASQTVNHASTEYGPSTDMRVDTPRTNLDDPGVGLRNNGRRVLVLSDLHTIGGAMDKRIPEREIELHLTGNMERYSWSFDGLEFGDSTPIHFRHGERLRVILHNDTMMTHPMHLHGMWSELENDRGEFIARLHTISIQPAQRISFQVTADALGRWAWHCHLLFHMDAGMFRQVVVS